MITLFNQPPYEMVSGLEVREQDWLRLRQTGLWHFVFRSVKLSWGGSIGALLVLQALMSAVGNGAHFHLTSQEWTLLVFGLYGIGASLFYYVRAWFRLEARFPRD